MTQAELTFFTQVPRSLNEIQDTLEAQRKDSSDIASELHALNQNIEMMNHLLESMLERM